VQVAGENSFLEARSEALAVHTVVSLYPNN